MKIVIKIGSSTLTGKAGSALNVEAVEKLVEVVARLKSQGNEVVIVSSGAIAAGLAPIGLTTRPKDLASQQAAASVGQGLLIAKYNEALNMKDYDRLYKATIFNEIIEDVKDLLDICGINNAKNKPTIRFFT